VSLKVECVSHWMFNAGGRRHLVKVIDDSVAVHPVVVVTKAYRQLRVYDPVNGGLKDSRLQINAEIRQRNTRHLRRIAIISKDETQIRIGCAFGPPFGFWAQVCVAIIPYARENVVGCSMLGIEIDRPVFIWSCSEAAKERIRMIGQRLRRCRFESGRIRAESETRG